MRRSSHGKSSGSSGGDGMYNVHGGGRNARALMACYTKARRPSKWDDAHKWVSTSRAPGDDDDGRQRSSGADDGHTASRKGAARHTWDWGDAARDETEMKRVVVVESDECRRFATLCRLRDVGTEMTPGGSKEPSRTTTPRSAAPPTAAACRVAHLRAHAGGGSTTSSQAVDGAADLVAAVVSSSSPATAWNEAERAKHTARYRREDLKIQAWENRERRKAELQMKTTEVKAERRKTRAREKAAGKLAAAEAVAKEKRARAEAKLRRRVAGEVRPRDRFMAAPSSLSLKLPLLCS